MQSKKNFKIIIPLNRATNKRTCGIKAASLSSLLKSGFTVADGFCLSADAYKSHLWNAGVRTLTRDLPTDEESAALRKAIIENELPDDVRSALQAACKSIGEDVELVVRHSATDEDTIGRAYAAVTGIRGFDLVVQAVKEVWASLWSDEAVRLREGLENRSEPAMAVLVQKMVDARVSGTVVAANPTTGNPAEVHICSVSESPHAAATDQMISVNLADFSIKTMNAPYSGRPSPHDDSQSEDEPADENRQALSYKQLIELTETALLIENTLGNRQMIRWVHDGERFMIMGVRMIGPERQCFPVTWRSAKEGVRLWKLVSPECVPYLVESLAVFKRARLRSLPSARSQIAVRIQNGRPYRRVAYPWEARSRFAVIIDLLFGPMLYRKWRSAARWIITSSRRELGRPVQKLSNRALKASIREAVSRVDLSTGWYEALAYPAERFSYLLREMLTSSGAPANLLSQLLMGHDPVWIERDSAFQRLAAYAWQAQQYEETIDAPGEIAQKLAGELGYVFESPTEAYELAGWRSWAEDQSSLIGIAEALAKGPLVDAQLAHEAACSAAKDAEKCAAAAIGASCSLLRRPISCMVFKALLRRARAFAAAENECDQAHALALSVLRVYVTELGRRLMESGVLSTAEDVFQLSAEELYRTCGKVGKQKSEWLRRLVAERKHRMWLMGRLRPPEWLPLGAGPSSPEPPERCGRLLVGRPASPGIVLGRTRVAYSPVEAAQLQPGEILVTNELSPAWTPLLGLAGGLVLGCDDLLSRGASTARNYNIPCICGLPNASILRTGQLVRLDGSAGTIEVVKRTGQTAGAKVNTNQG